MDGPLAYREVVPLVLVLIVLPLAGLPSLSGFNILSHFEPVRQLVLLVHYSVGIVISPYCSPCMLFQQVRRPAVALVLPPSPPSCDRCFLLPFHLQMSQRIIHDIFRFLMIMRLKPCHCVANLVPINLH